MQSEIKLIISLIGFFLNHLFWYQIAILFKDNINFFNTWSFITGLVVFIIIFATLIEKPEVKHNQEVNKG